MSHQNYRVNEANSAGFDSLSKQPCEKANAGFNGVPSLRAEMCNNFEADLFARLDRIDQTLSTLVARQAIKEWYATDEFASIVGRSEFTCREWCRLRRVNATKRRSGRGKHFAWVISHDELLRFQREGLLPLQTHG